MSDSTEYTFLEARPPARSDARDAIFRQIHADENEVVDRLLDRVELNEEARRRVQLRAGRLVGAVRARREEQGALEAFMQEYDLSSEEGVVLMCLAEALLRIPDTDTAEKLIADKLQSADWESHLGKSSSLFVNASTWGLMLTGQLVRLGTETQRDFRSVLRRLVNRGGEPVVRTAIRQAMRIMGFQFVMGRTIKEALDRAEKKAHRGYRYSFDMLGEAALTWPDAERYMEAYRQAIAATGARRGGSDIFSAPSLSVKLSALHPRYEFGQRDRVLRELAPRVLELATLAREQDMGLTVDAEEADRLLLSLDIIDRVLSSEELEGWDGFGLALQTYLKCAPEAIDWVADVARRTGHRVPIRLVKGAYWDSEIKHAQEEGFDGYPVYTRKVNTDLSYIACSRKVLGLREQFYPQFATHNAHTLAVITEMAGDRLDYEFQRLWGMGEELYAEARANGDFNTNCRVYAPVGSHEDLLPYLVRRLLENGANQSFVNRIVDERLPVEEVVEDPVARARRNQPRAHPAIPMPVDIYGGERVNSRGVDLSNELGLRELARAMEPWGEHHWLAGPATALQDGEGGEPEPVTDPADPEQVVGEVTPSTGPQVDAAVEAAHAFAPAWDATPVEERAAALESAADAMEANLPEFLALCAREAGKTIDDGVAEVREAVDFLRYYAFEARRRFSAPLQLPGPTGETNHLSLHGRGVFACISPWNFPLAIFTGQVSAALAAGNTVLAKPAEQTPLVASRAVALLHDAGIPREALQLLPGDGATVGARLSGHPLVSGVAFTGSTETARLINQTLASRDAALPALVAETGGQNAMIVDSSALPEQVVKDVIGSAFLSAGQRCSALRVLYVQEDVADRILTMLEGAMQQLVLGAPGLLTTDVGPVIDPQALAVLQAHADRLESEGRLLARTPVDRSLPGYFFPPSVFAIDGIDSLEREVFGPILHVVRFRGRDLDKVIDGINATGYGLTLGVHSRIESTQKHIAARARVGNCYINRTMTGAVVGVQPFGGEGLSGTGPKAGGPHYLLKFATERALTVNTAAVGGNASLLAMED